MDVVGRIAFGGQIAGSANLAVAPGTNLFQFADGPVEDQLAHPVEIRGLMALRADLRGQLVFVLEPGGANDTGFLHAVDQRLFTIDVFAAVHRPVGDEGVRVIQGAADNGVNVLLLKTLAPVYVTSGLGELLADGGQSLLIDITEGDHILVGSSLEMIARAVPGGDEDDV